MDRSFLKGRPAGARRCDGREGDPRHGVARLPRLAATPLPNRPTPLPGRVDDLRTGQGSRRAQPLTLAAPVSMCPVTRRDHELSPLTVTVKSYQPLAIVTALK